MEIGITTSSVFSTLRREKLKGLVGQFVHVVFKPQGSSLLDFRNGQIIEVYDTVIVIDDEGELTPILTLEIIAIFAMSLGRSSDSLLWSPVSVEELRGHLDLDRPGRYNGLTRARTATRAPDPASEFTGE